MKNSPTKRRGIKIDDFGEKKAARQKNPPMKVTPPISWEYRGKEDYNILKKPSGNVIPSENKTKKNTECGMRN